MILNSPTAEELTDSALRLYFSAWGMLSEFYIEFKLRREEDFTTDADEADAYRHQSQQDLQTIATLFQQANEIALKAEICKVSPYLLLVNSEMKFKSSQTDVEFSDLRTLDAVDLPLAVATFADKKLSDQFMTQYNQLRSLRNGLIHLGRAKEPLDPAALIDLALFQYAELWPDRNWLTDRLATLESSRSQFFSDYKYHSPHMLAMDEWVYMRTLIKRAHYKRLFRVEKGKRRYLCMHCVDSAAMRYAGFEDHQAGTAYLDPLVPTISCLMCSQTYPIRREDCPEDGCKGNVLSDDPDYRDNCHTCGCGPHRLGRR
ncbi:hypothetical protein [Bosea sp. TAF32]|uniref:hypothetical protein n=1 Tax=Bosea sp. TAF32 TaxID=3237482 RepID=UPI003F9125CC